MNLIKNIATRNWKEKLICLILAAAVWYLIKNNIAKPQALPDWPRPAATSP